MSTVRQASMEILGEEKSGSIQDGENEPLLNRRGRVRSPKEFFQNLYHRFLIFIGKEHVYLVKSPDI